MEPPARYVCPIGQDLMRDPVMCPDGHNFDRPNIQAWLNKEKHCPLDRKNLTKDQLYPNRALKEEIEEWEKNEKNRQNLPRANTAPDLAPTVPSGPVGVPRTQSEGGAAFAAQHSNSYQSNYNASAPPVTPSVERDGSVPYNHYNQQQPPPQQYGSYQGQAPQYYPPQQQHPGQYSYPPNQANSNNFYGYGPAAPPPQYQSYQQQGEYSQGYSSQHQHQQQYQHYQQPPPNYNPSYQAPPPQTQSGYNGAPPAGGAWQSSGGQQYAPPQAWQQPQGYGHSAPQGQPYAPVVPVPQSNPNLYKDQPWRRYGMKQEEYDNIVATFCMVDQDDSGQLDRDEVRSMCEMLGYPSNPSAINGMFQTVDRDGSGTIDLHEFVTYMIDHRPRPEDQFGMTRMAYQQLQLQFHEFDKNRDGSLNKQELQQLCKNMGYPHATEIIDRMFYAMDTDRSGSLSFHEFLVWMKDNQPRQLAQTNARR